MNTFGEQPEYNNIEEDSRILIQLIQKKNIITINEIFEETGIPIHIINEILTILSCTPLVKKLGVPGKYIWCGHDVEELKKVKEEIEKERKRLEELRQITNPTNN